MAKYILSIEEDPPVYKKLQRVALRSYPDEKQKELKNDIKKQYPNASPE